MWAPASTVTIALVGTCRRTVVTMVAASRLSPDPNASITPSLDAASSSRAQAPAVRSGRLRASSAVSSPRGPAAEAAGSK